MALTSCPDFPPALVADPDIMKRVQVDKGAIRFIMKGADVMCPGLTSAGGLLPDEDWPKNTPVVSAGVSGAARRPPHHGLPRQRLRAADGSAAQGERSRRAALCACGG